MDIFQNLKGNECDTLPESYRIMNVIFVMIIMVICSFLGKSPASEF